jgi:hypothetical protein
MKKLIVSVIGLLTLATSAFAQIGSIDKDLVYTPVTPCRIFDSRISQGGSGPVAAGGIKAFNVWGVGSYASQGGSPTNCGIVAGSDTAAIAVSMAVVSPAGQGYLTAFPGNVADAAKPLAATLNYNAGEVVVSNAAILKVAQSATPDLKIFSSNATEIIVDVVGYYSKPVATALECTVVNSEIFSVPVGFSNFHYTTSTCAAGYTAVSAYCYNQTNPDIYLTGSGTNGGAWCGWRSFAPTAANVTQGTNCCRIPGR